MSALGESKDREGGKDRGVGGRPGEERGSHVIDSLALSPSQTISALSVLPSLSLSSMNSPQVHPTVS